jgi:hypothetical protein
MADDVRLHVFLYVFRGSLAVCPFHSSLVFEAFLS